MALFLILLIFLTAPPASASFNAAAKGTSSAGFLTLGSGARGVAMGGAYSAVVDNAEAMFWNPAALLRVKNRSVTFMHAAYIASTYYDYGAYVQNLGDEDAFGVGLQYFSSGDMMETDVNGVDLGKFSPDDYSLSFGYAMLVRDIKLGFVLKYVHSTILSTAKTVASDIGVMFPPVYDGKVRFAVVGSNIGGGLKYEEKTEALPGIVKLGGVYTSNGFGLYSLDVGFPQDDSPYLAMGYEYPLRMSDPWRLLVRCGFNSQTVGDIKGFTGASFGFGVGYDKYVFDYAFSPLGDLGAAHRMAVSVKF
ncbi:MAG: PorV/PorQ family protein [Elusimicrobia bacterium]|nr:PorV/PorQ family protein [Elusimicrobiota bacterium]